MSEQANQYAVEMEGITKVFLDTIIANNNISLKVKKGEIHALVGENGAGKSTLMSILFGLYQPTKGLIKINGKEVAISGSIKAGELGIGMVHQHFKLVDNFTMTQNIILGSEPIVKWQWLNYKKAKKRIIELSEKYKLNIDPNLKVENSTVGMQQRVEILKVLYRGADIIVLDEPTAVLTPQEIIGLLDIVKELKQAGKTIIFIGHKLGEVKAIADSVTVIRNGKVVDTFLAKDKTKEEIATLMVGRELVEVKNTSKIALGPELLKIEDLSIKKMNSKSLANNAIKKWINFNKEVNELSHKQETKDLIIKIKLENKEKVKDLNSELKHQNHQKVKDQILEIKNKYKAKRKEIVLSIREKEENKNSKEQLLGLEDFNLVIKSGEIVAVAGVEGNGQSELIYGLTGLMKTVKGKVSLLGKDVTNFNAHKLYKNGLSHIPEDRHKYGLVLDYTVIDNMVLQNVSEYPFSKFGLLRRKAIQSHAQKIINQYDVRGSNSGFAITRGLSGGNQQKAVVGRELIRNHKLLIVAQPTRGLDIGAIEYIHARILEEKEKGNAVLLVSYELGEVMTLADRIVVLHSGKIQGNVSAKNIKRETLGLMMAGQKWENSKNEEMGGRENNV